MDPDLRTVLFDLYCEHDPEIPPPAAVDAWCARFPQHARAIRRDIAMSVREELVRNRVPLHYRSAKR